MGDVSNNLPNSAPLGGSTARLRKFDRTDSELATEETTRLTADIEKENTVGIRIIPAAAATAATATTTSPNDNDVDDGNDDNVIAVTNNDDDDDDDDDNDDGISDYGELPPPPDGGYGWVICFASFMCNMVVDGIAYTFGIFLENFALYYNENKGTVAWVGSLLSGVYLSAGPIVSALANKYGCRTVCIAGSIIGCIAFALSTLAPNVNILMITYGVIGGFGFGMIYLPAVVAVGYYFETKRSLATGIAVCGSGVGTFTFAPLATYLLENLGWKNSLLIFAALILSCAVFGAMMRPLTYPKKKKTKSLMQRMYEEKQLQMERGSFAGSHFMVQLPDGTMERKLKMPLNADPGVHSSLNLELLAQQASYGSNAGGTPSLHPVSTLPTITEAKVVEHNNEQNNDNNGQLLDIKRYNKRSPRTSENETTPLAGSGGGNTINITPIQSPYITADKITRNASQPAFSSDHHNLPKNGSVPSFNRIRKTSASERFQPSLAAIRAASSRGELMDVNNVELGTSKLSLSQRQDSTGRMVRPMSRKDIFYSGSVTNLPQYQSQKSLTNYRNSVLSLTKYERSMQSIRMHDPLAEAERQREQYDLCPCLHLPDSLKSVFNTMLDVSLLKNPVFMLIGISNVFGMAGLYVPFVYIVGAAKMSGIDNNSASFLLSVIGITNTIGRVICGYVADFPQVNSLFLNNCCLLISTVAVGLTPFCQSYNAYVIMCIFFGIAVSGYISLTSIILVDLLGLDKLTNAFGLLILFRGAAAIIGPPLAGAIFDATGKYDLPFYVASLFFLIATITSFAVPFLKRCIPSDEISIHGEALTPIDEELAEDIEDEEDQPITIVPKIIKTLPSPQDEKFGNENIIKAESKL